MTKKSSLTITIPPIRSKNSPSSPKEHMEDGPVKRKRKLPSRYLDAVDSESYADPEPERKMARTSTTGKPRQQSTAELDFVAPTHPSDDGELDVMDEAHDEEEQDGMHSECPPLQSVTSSKSQAKPTKSKAQPTPDAGPARKKARTNKRVVVSDSEDEVDYMDTSQDVPEDDDYPSQDEKPPKSKGKVKAAPKRLTTQKAPSKRKTKSETNETGRGKKQPVKKPPPPPAPPKPEESLIDVVGDSSPHEPPVNTEQSSPITSKQEPTTPAPPTPAPLPKKPKLPTIKKTKGAGTSGLNTPISAGATGKKLPLEIGVGNQLNHTEIRKTLINKTDIDLSNKSIYQEIFLKTGSGDGATPRRTKEEERRKELNRMREEAKAKRAAETLHSFDLQAQFEKISRFEEKLKAGRSSALYPNYLAGKWRDQYDRNNRRQKEQEQWSESVDPGKEDGEVN